MALIFPYIHFFFIIGIVFSLNSNAMECSVFDRLTFETERSTVKPLRLENLEEAREVDGSDSSYVEIIAAGDDTSIDQVLQTQENALESSDLNYARDNLTRGILYYGVFLKEDNSIIGLSKITAFYRDIHCVNEKHLLSSDIKYHKAHQGKGYATEVTKGLLHHYQNCKLIPSTQDDIETSVFQGFHGLVHLSNKASLKCTLNSGYKVSRLFGDRVEFTYPFVISIPEPKESFFPSVDEKLHGDIRETLGQYLSREGALEDAEKAEGTLRQISLCNLMSVSNHLVETAWDSESPFIVTTMAKFPQLFQDFPAQYSDIRTLLLKQKQEIPPEAEVPASHLALYRAYLQNLEKALENMGNLSP